MKAPLLTTIFLLGCLPPLLAQAPTEKIERLLEASGAAANFTQVIDKMIEVQRQDLTMDSLTSKFWDDFSAEIHASGYASLKPELIAVYREMYTEAEIDHLLAYLEDPVTKQILAKQPELMDRTMTIGAAWGRKLGTEIAERLERATEHDAGGH